MIAAVPGRTSRISFARLPEISPDEMIAHMSDPRVAEHMPLLTFTWDRQHLAEFIRIKEECWRRDGLGHWAFLYDGNYVGWGGFQKEGEEWDFGMVLRPDAFGLGPAIAAKAIHFARCDERIPCVTLLLPHSRKHLRGLARLGAEYIGDVDYQGARFRKFALVTADEVS